MMYMNPFTGSVGSLEEWREDFSAMTTQERVALWGGPNFEDALLLPVEWDENSHEWKEAD